MMLTPQRIRLATIALLVSISACNQDEEGTPAAAPSQLNEACEKTADCRPGLACVVSTGGSICLSVDLVLAPNDNECAAVECEDAQQCCDDGWTVPSACVTARSNCAINRTTYASQCALAEGPACQCDPNRDFLCEKGQCVRTACQVPLDCCARFIEPSNCASARTYCSADPNSSYCLTANGPTCNCSEATFKCVENACLPIRSCTSDASCQASSTSTPYCLDSQCVECVSNSDCDASTEECVFNICQTPECKTDVDCDPFNICGLDSTCQLVGCQSDRECMINRRSYLAFCDTTVDPPTCQVHCERDTDCRTADNPLGLCVNTRCLDPGCETNEECKLRLEYSTQLPDGTRAVCRAKGSG
jgi:hypothetical protein